jgi:PPM family protein phosphatase
MSKRVPPRSQEKAKPREAASTEGNLPVEAPPPQEPVAVQDPPMEDPPMEDPPVQDPPVQEPPEETLPSDEEPPVQELSPAAEAPPVEEDAGTKPEANVGVAAGGTLEELVELVEPQEDETVPEPLPVGAELTAPEGASFRITAVRREGDVCVYDGTMEGEDRRVCLRQAHGGAGARRLRQEAMVLEAVDSPMFPRLLAFFEQDGKLYLATDPTDGPTLADSLSQAEMPFPQFLTVLAQVAFALSRLHAKGWAHLGIRPGTIVLGKPVKVLDFNYATRLGQRPPSAFHHAGFSPPELLTDEPIDARADIYAVGALLFHAVNGRPIAETGAELSTWDPPTPVAGVPQILHRCLGSRETRYEAMEDLHRDLLRLARRHAPPVAYSIASATSIGLEPSRVTNQDAHVYLTGRLESDEGPQSWAMLCVCDGMGGMAAGEVASAAAVQGVLAEAAPLLARAQPIAAEEQVQLVRSWVHAGNKKACAALDVRRAQGGATMVCASILGRRLAAGHIGDCRMYLLREGKMTPLTRDHSLVMALVLQGEIKLEELRQHPDRSKVTRSIGDRDPLPEYYVDTLEQATGSPIMELHPGDILLLCSDGLWEPVVEEEMRGAIESCAPDLNAAAQALVQLALERGGPDNIALILFRLEESSARKVD